MAGYIALYSILFLFLTLGQKYRFCCYETKQKYKRYLMKSNRITLGQMFLGLSFALLVLWGGLRGNISIDITKTYYRFFNNIDSETVVNHFDFLFRKLFLFLYYNFDSFQVILFVTAFIFVSCVYYATEMESLFPAYSILLFAMFDFYYGGLNQIRQYLGMGVILVAVSYYRKKRTILAIGAVVIAGLFHSGCFLFLLVFILDRMKISKRLYAFILFASPVSLLVAKPLIEYVFSIYAGGQYYIYITNPHQGYGLIGKLVIPLIKTWGLACIYLFNYDDIKEIENSSIYLNSLLISCVVALFGALNSEVVRIVNLFFFPQIIYIANSSNIILRKKSKARCFLALYMLFNMSYFAYLTYSHMTEYPYEMLTYI